MPRRAFVALDVLREPGESVFPESAVVGNEGGRVIERTGEEMTTLVSTVSFTADEARALEDIEVLRYGRQRHRKGGREFAHGIGPARELTDEPSPRRVGEGLEDGLSSCASFFVLA